MLFQRESILASIPASPAGARPVGAPPRAWSSSIALLAAVGLALGGCAAQTRTAGLVKVSHAAVEQEQTPSFTAASVAPAGAASIEAPKASPPPPPVPAMLDVAALAEMVKPAVVNITTTREVRFPAFGPPGASPFRFFFPTPEGFNEGSPEERMLRQTGAGSGFIIDTAGYVVTNEHVVHDATEVRVRLADDRELRGEVVGRDPKLDLALLKLEGARDLPVAALGSSEALRVGEPVLAVGNPFGLGHTVTLGIVSAKARTLGAGPYDDFIQTDASINPGNSGGPLFNARGEVVGINTAIKPGANSIGFAIPVDALKDILPQLRETGHVERGRLGLMFQPVTPDLARALQVESTRGALISNVEPGGPAARAGLREGDVIVAINDAALRSADDLPRKVARNRPGTRVKVTVLRQNEKREVFATLDALADDEESRANTNKSPSSGPRVEKSEPKLGLKVSNNPSGGARVDAVLDGGPRGELREGDVITELNGAAVRDVKDLSAALDKAKPGTTALIKVRRGGITRFAAVPIPKR
jgi:serine protease Do